MSPPSGAKEGGEQGSDEEVVTAGRRDFRDRDATGRARFVTALQVSTIPSASEWAGGFVEDFAAIRAKTNIGVAIVARIGGAVAVVGARAGAGPPERGRE